MSTGLSRRRGVRIALFVLLGVAVIVLGLVAAVLLPIMTHSSAGGSGQEVPTDYVSETSATGADDRTRTLSVTGIDGAEVDPAALVPGEPIVVTGSGFDASIGIYVAICAVPETAGEKPGPCLGGVPEGAETGDVDESELTSVWVSNDWAWRAFATDRYEDPAAGSFTVRFAVPPATSEALDCRVTRCAIATRADHTASSDRVQDMLLPVAFAQ